jgi:hypothetical protein
MEPHADGWPLDDILRLHRLMQPVDALRRHVHVDEGRRVAALPLIAFEERRELLCRRAEGLARGAPLAAAAGPKGTACQSGARPLHPRPGHPEPGRRQSHQH